MIDRRSRAGTVVGAVAAGLLATAFLPMAVAFADEYDFTPDTTTLVPSQVEGYPPLVNEVTGYEYWNIYDLTQNDLPRGSDALQGTDTETTIGSFTNDDYLYTNTFGGIEIEGSTSNFYLPNDAQIDLANFGGGFENEWIDIPANGTDPGVSDLLITPFGDFSLLGSAFSDLATVIG
jgi:hypothetical protein